MDFRQCHVVDSSTPSQRASVDFALLVPGLMHRQQCEISVAKQWRIHSWPAAHETHLHFVSFLKRTDIAQHEIDVPGERRIGSPGSRGPMRGAEVAAVERHVGEVVGIDDSGRPASPE